MATNPTPRGGHRHDLSRLLKPFQVRVTRLAYGIPVGATIWSTPTTPPSCAPWEGRRRCRMRRVLVIPAPRRGQVHPPAPWRKRWACRPSIWTGCGGSPGGSTAPARSSTPGWTRPWRGRLGDGRQTCAPCPGGWSGATRCSFWTTPGGSACSGPSGGSCAGAGAPAPDMAEGPGAAGPGVHPLDLGFPPHPAARVLELLSAWKGEAHIFRSPAQCADFLNRLE